jgi:hypothetical protein
MQVMALLLLLLHAALTAALPHRHHHHHHHHRHHHHHNLTNIYHNSTNHIHPLPFLHPRTLPQLNTTSPFPTPFSPPNPSLTAYRMFLGFFIFGVIVAILFPLCAAAPAMLNYYRRKNTDPESFPMRGGVEAGGVTGDVADESVPQRPASAVLPVEREV